MNASKRRRDAEFLIDDFVVVTCEIDCEMCGKRDSLVSCDSADATSSFYEDGWRVVKDRLLCKKCRRKR